jgi:hypothetical protein
MLAIAKCLTVLTVNKNKKQKQEKQMKNKKIDGYKFRTKLAKLIPNYSMDVDNDGQVIIYTNLKEIKNDKYKEMK